MAPHRTTSPCSPLHRPARILFWIALMVMILEEFSWVGGPSTRRGARELILKAATELIESDGLAQASAREVARRIGYSPGTLYNVFDNLDDLVLTIEARLLDRLAARLAEVPSASSPQEQPQRLAETYLRFTSENPRLWNLLFEHHMPAGKDIPAWYRMKLDGLMARIEEALTPVMNSTPPHASAPHACCGPACTVSPRSRPRTNCRTSRARRRGRSCTISSRPTWRG